MAPVSRPPLLFSPLELRGLTLKNRVVISPMCQYSAREGLANDWHFAHLARFAMGGAALVFTEATAVERNGRITYGDLGIWTDAHVDPLKRIVSFIKAQGGIAAVQLAHAGRKASMQRPWHGNGPLGDADRARGESEWRIVAPSAIPLDQGWLVPEALTLAEIASIQSAWRDATRRARAAGFDVVEIHGAHGYLIHSFLSPISNRRTDAYGGERAGRMRFALEVADIVRAEWPEDRPVFVRVSSADGVDGGWAIEDSVALARELKLRGIDVIDCSSGGIAGSATAAGVKRSPGFQVPYAARIRSEANIATMAVGLILHPAQAEAVLESGEADLIAIGRQALFDPNWALHAQLALGLDSEFAAWPVQSGWWLERRQRQLGPEDARAALRAPEVA
jgi:2,4-dienoyl-CoA reductase-like NADH-dependent reductase (Old Yellow Enzyme family)